MNYTHTFCVGKAWVLRIYNVDFVPELDVIAGARGDKSVAVAILGNCMLTDFENNVSKTLLAWMGEKRAAGSVLALVRCPVSSFVPEPLPSKAHAVMDFERRVLQTYKCGVAPRQHDHNRMQTLWAWFRDRLRLSPFVQDVLLSGSVFRETNVRSFSDVDAVVVVGEVEKVNDLLNDENFGPVWYEEAFHSLTSFFDGTLRNLEDGSLVLEDSSAPLSPWDNPSLVAWLIVGRRMKIPRSCVRKIVEHAFDWRAFVIRRQGCSVGLCLGTRTWCASCLTFDFVPAMREGTNLFIQHRQVGLIQVNLEYTKSELDRLDKRLGGLLRDLIRWVKAWNTQMSSRDPLGESRKPFKSFHVEIICCDFARQYNFGVEVLSAPLFTDFVVHFFDYATRAPFFSCSPGLDPLSASPLFPCWNFRDVKNLLRDAAQRLRESQKMLNEGNLAKCVSLWEEVFQTNILMSSHKVDVTRQYQQSMSRRKVRGGEWLATSAGSLFSSALLRSSLELPLGVQKELLDALSEEEKSCIRSRVLENRVGVSYLLNQFGIQFFAFHFDATKYQICLENWEYLCLIDERNISDVANIGKRGELLLSATKGGEKSLEFLDRLGLFKDFDEVAMDASGLTLTPLSLACMVGNLSSVQFLVKAGASINSLRGSRYPLQLAAAYGHREIVYFLLDHGADPLLHVEGHKYLPIHYAIRGGHANVVQILSASYHWSGDIVPVFSFSCAKGSWSCQDVLLESGIAETEIKTHFGQPLISAVATGDIRVVSKVLDLLCAEVEPVVVDEFKTTPLQTAAQLGYFDICRLLVQRGAQVNRRCTKPLEMHDSLSLALEAGHFSVYASLRGQTSVLSRNILFLHDQNKFVAPKWGEALTRFSSIRPLGFMDVFGESDSFLLCIRLEKAKNLVVLGAIVTPSDFLYLKVLDLIPRNDEFTKILLDYACEILRTTESDGGLDLRMNDRSIAELIEEFSSPLQQGQGKTRKVEKANIKKKKRKHNKKKKH